MSSAAMHIARTGLDAQDMRMRVISNNLANVNTTGFKKDRAAFETALRERAYRDAHREALRHAYEEAGVSGVPMFVIGDRVLTGLQDKATLESAIEAELAANREQ